MPTRGEGGAMAPIAIVVRNLRKSFGTHEVLKGVSLTAHEGDVVAIIGGSGSGKSTMLRCINFLETPSGGSIEIGGEPVRMHADGAPSDRRQLERLRQSALANDNVFAVLMDAVRCCSLGQITRALFEVGGQYRRNM